MAPIPQPQAEVFMELTCRGLARSAPSDDQPAAQPDPPAPTPRTPTPRPPVVRLASDAARLRRVR